MGLINFVRLLVSFTDGCETADEHDGGDGDDKERIPTCLDQGQSRGGRDLSRDVRRGGGRTKKGESET